MSEINEDYKDAVAFLEMFSKELDTDPDIIDAMSDKEVREELESLGADVEGFHRQFSEKLADSDSEGVFDRVIKWISPLWEPMWAGQHVGAADIPEQDNTFIMEDGDIRLYCSWERADEIDPAHILLTWENNLTVDRELQARFINPETQEIRYQINLGTYQSGEVVVKSDALGFDPSKERWAISILLMEIKE